MASTEVEDDLDDLLESEWPPSTFLSLTSSLGTQGERNLAPDALTP